MAKRRNENVVSLFPFLAVLVCTMGALILLLLVTTRRIRQKQQLAVPVEVAKELPPSIPMVSLAKWKNAEEQLAVASYQYTALQEELESETERLATARETLQSLQSLLANAHSERGDARARQQHRTEEAQSDERNIERLVSERQRLRDQIQQKQQQVGELNSQLMEAEKLADAAEMVVAQRISEVELLRQQAAGPREQPSVVSTPETVIEFSNPRGTARTPIIVEIDGDGFLFPSTNVRLRKEDLTGFRASDNPLLSAILVTHRYRSQDSLASQPYVLLVVRPSGILGFYPAQRVLQQAKIHFGYELATEKLVIAHAEPADGEAAAVELAISNALSRRNNQLASTADIRRRITALRAMQARDGIRPQQPDEFARRYGQPAKELATPRRNAVEEDTRAVASIQPSTLPRDDNSEFSNEEPVLAEASEQMTDSGSGADRPTEWTDQPDSQQDVMNPGMAVELALQQALATRDSARRTVALGSSGTGPAESQANTVDSGEIAFGDVEFSPGESQVASTEMSESTAMRGMQSRTMDLRQPSVRGQHAKSDDRMESAFSDAAEIDNSVNRDESSWSGQQANNQASQQPVPIPLDGQRFQDHSRADQPTQRSDSARLAGKPSGNTPSGGQPGQQGSGPMSPTHADQRLTYYQPFTVYLDPQYRTVGTEEPRKLLGQPVSIIVQSLIDDLTSADRRGPEVSWLRSIPAVTFVVSPGAHTLYLQLARDLERVGIPSSSLVSLESHVQEHVEGPGAAFEKWAPDADVEPSRQQINPAAATEELP